MGFVALIAWFVTALGGLYMLAVWLIEHDATDQASTASRLPLPVILAHMSLAVTGLAVWVAYLLLDRRILAWAALAVLGAIAMLGVAMFARWIPVYRAPDLVPAPVAVPLGAPAEPVPGVPAPASGPPEGNFPLFVVIAHGTFAVSTVVLVLLSALGVGSS